MSISLRGTLHRVLTVRKSASTTRRESVDDNESLNSSFSVNNPSALTKDSGIKILESVDMGTVLEMTKAPFWFSVTPSGYHEESVRCRMGAQQVVLVLEDDECMISGTSRLTATITLIPEGRVSPLCKTESVNPFRDAETSTQWFNFLSSPIITCHIVGVRSNDITSGFTLKIEISDLIAAFEFYSGKVLDGPLGSIISFFSSMSATSITAQLSFPFEGVIEANAEKCVKRGFVKMKLCLFYHAVKQANYDPTSSSSRIVTY